MQNSQLTKLRESRNLSQAELAALIGVSASAMSAYEQGTRSPRDEVKVRIARFFGVSVLDLFFNTLCES